MCALTEMNTRFGCLKTEVSLHFVATGGLFIFLHVWGFLLVGGFSQLQAHIHTHTNTK